MGITIIDVKIVGTCSKHRTDKSEILTYSDGRIVDDKDIACIECML